MPGNFSNHIQFKALFEYATEGILVADENGHIQVANPSAERLFGYGPDELNGKKVEVLIPRRYAQHHDKLRGTFNAHPGARSMGRGRDLFGITKNGREFPVEISLSPYETEFGNFTIAFIIDISARKKDETAIELQKNELENLTRELEKRVKDRTMILEEALEQLEISRKELHVALAKEKELNEMKSRFVAMASHEIRTPLTTILSSLSLINKYSETDNKEKQQQHIQRIKSSITNMTALLDDVLSISTLEEGRVLIFPDTLSLKGCVETVVQELSQSANEGQSIQYTHSGISAISFDKKILRIILINLITNALKFSPEKTIVFVNTDVTNQDLSIRVQDHGIGIADEDKVHLFERFYRGGNATNIQGTGLGLSIIARYVELLKGIIKVDSHLHEGTTITITIPNQSPDA